MRSRLSLLTALVGVVLMFAGCVTPEPAPDSSIEEDVVSFESIDAIVATLNETYGSDDVLVVLDIDKNKQEISLGMKQTEVNPWELVAEKYPPGTIIEGEVRNLANYGAFIEIEPGIDGLLHVSDMSWTKKVTQTKVGKSFNKIFKKTILICSKFRITVNRLLQLFSAVL